MNTAEKASAHQLGGHHGRAFSLVAGGIESELRRRDSEAGDVSSPVGVTGQHLFY